MPRKPPFLGIFTPTLGLFMLAMILANVGGSMFFPFFSLLLRGQGFPVETIGLYFTVAAVFPLLFQILGGWISDRIGRIRSIAWGSAAGALSWIGLLYAPYSGSPLAWYLGSNAVGAITVSLVAPSFDAFLAEQSEESNRARVYGTIQALYAVVGVLGPPLGGYVAQRWGYGVLAWCAAGLYWAATAIRLGMAKGARRPSAAPAGAGAAGEADGSAAPGGLGLGASLKAMLGLFLAGGLFTWILLVDGVFDIGGKLSGDLLPLYLREIGGLAEGRIGLLQGLAAILSALFMVPMGHLADRRGERWPIALGGLLVAASSLLLALGRGFPVFALAFALFGVAMASFGPPLQSLVSKAVPERLRGLAFGFLSTSLGLFSFLAPGLGALLWKRFFPALPLLLSGGMTLLTIPLILRFLKAPVGGASLDGGAARKDDGAVAVAAAVAAGAPELPEGGFEPAARKEEA